MPIELVEKEWTGKDILNIPMVRDDNDAEAESIGDYLQTLLWDLFNQGEGFNSKRPFGNSSWEYEMYKALVVAGACEGTLDEDGYIEKVNESQAIDLIQAAILAMYKLPPKLKKKNKSK